MQELARVIKVDGRRDWQHRGVAHEDRMVQDVQVVVLEAP